MCYLQAPVARAVVCEVLRRTGRREMFTALDISRAVQASGHRAPHGEMKQLVHALFTYGKMGPDYARTGVPVGRDQRTAFLYHCRDVSPDLYVNARQSVAKLLDG